MLKAVLTSLTVASALLVSTAPLSAETYTRVVFPGDHLIWEYYPPDAAYEDLVSDNKGCLFYLYDGAVHPVTDVDEKQLCQDASGGFGDIAAPSPRF